MCLLDRTRLSGLYLLSCLLVFLVKATPAPQGMVVRQSVIVIGTNQQQQQPANNGNNANATGKAQGNKLKGLLNRLKTKNNNKQAGKNANNNNGANNNKNSTVADRGDAPPPRAIDLPSSTATASATAAPAVNPTSAPPATAAPSAPPSTTAAPAATTAPPPQRYKPKVNIKWNYQNLRADPSFNPYPNNAVNKTNGVKADSTSAAPQATARPSNGNGRQKGPSGRYCCRTKAQNALCSTLYQNCHDWNSYIVCAPPPPGVDIQVGFTGGGGGNIEYTNPTLNELPQCSNGGPTDDPKGVFLVG